MAIGFIPLVVKPVTAELSSQTPTGSSLETAFKEASREFGVPVDLLKAVGYAISHWEQRPGEASIDGGYGVMQLVENNEVHTLSWAVGVLGVPPDTLKLDAYQNIRGGAALLAAYATDPSTGEKPAIEKLEDWFEAVARYSNSRDPWVADSFARQVFAFLEKGVTHAVSSGEALSIAPRQLDLPEANVVALTAPDYPPAHWVPANPANYTVLRESASIDKIVIHTMQGYYNGAISWFQNPASQVSAHYLIRSSDGDITQMVEEKDIAWHAGNWSYNQRSIGIEHEGFISDASWYTEAMYRASAALTRYLADKYGIPKDRAHIIGHNEVPGATHTDPGPYWNWAYYMQLVVSTPTPTPTPTRTPTPTPTATPCTRVISNTITTCTGSVGPAATPAAASRGATGGW